MSETPKETSPVAPAGAPTEVDAAPGLGPVPISASDSGVGVAPDLAAQGRKVETKPGDSGPPGAEPGAETPNVAASESAPRDVASLDVAPFDLAALDPYAFDQLGVVAGAAAQGAPEVLARVAGPWDRLLETVRDGGNGGTDAALGLGASGEADAFAGAREVLLGTDPASPDGPGFERFARVHPAWFEPGLRGLGRKACGPLPGRCPLGLRPLPVLRTDWPSRFWPKKGPLAWFLSETKAPRPGQRSFGWRAARFLRVFCPWCRPLGKIWRFICGAAATRSGKR